MYIRPVHAIDPKKENPRQVPVMKGDMQFFTLEVDPVEPEPIGQYVVCVFQITGYDQDCDGSALARLMAVDKDGKHTGAELTDVGLYPDDTLVVLHPNALWSEAEKWYEFL